MANAAAATAKWLRRDDSSAIESGDLGGIRPASSKWLSVTLSASSAQSLIQATVWYVGHLGETCILLVWLRKILTESYSGIRGGFVAAGAKTRQNCICSFFQVIPAGSNITRSILPCMKVRSVYCMNLPE